MKNRLRSRSDSLRWLRARAAVQVWGLGVAARIAGCFVAAVTLARPLWHDVSPTSAAYDAVVLLAFAVLTDRVVTRVGDVIAPVGCTPDADLHHVPDVELPCVCVTRTPRSLHVDERIYAALEVLDDEYQAALADSLTELAAEAKTRRYFADLTTDTAPAPTPANPAADASADPYGDPSTWPPLDPDAPNAWEFNDDAYRHIPPPRHDA